MNQYQKDCLSNRLECLSYFVNKTDADKCFKVADNISIRYEKEKKFAIFIPLESSALVTLFFPLENAYISIPFELTADETPEKIESVAKEFMSIISEIEEKAPSILKQIAKKIETNETFAQEMKNNIKGLGEYHIPEFLCYMGYMQDYDKSRFNSILDKEILLNSDLIEQVLKSTLIQDTIQNSYRKQTKSMSGPKI